MDLYDNFQNIPKEIFYLKDEKTIFIPDNSEERVKKYRKAFPDAEIETRKKIHIDGGNFV